MGLPPLIDMYTKKKTFASMNGAYPPYLAGSSGQRGAGSNRWHLLLNSPLACGLPRI